MAISAANTTNIKSKMPLKSVGYFALRLNSMTAATSQPAIYAIGDVATYSGKLKLIMTGFAEAAHAAHAIHPLVFPGEALHFEYSTTKGVPAA